MTTALTVKQERFVAEYLVCDNAAEAARRAGYSVNCAKVTACRMLTKANLRDAIAEKRADLAQKIELSQGVVLAGIIGAISVARKEGDPGTVLRGWMAVAKITGLDKPEPATKVVSAEGERLRLKFQALSVEELLEVATGRVP
jgi:hypothetical protein